jgi:hypothetical protein
VRVISAKEAGLVCEDRAEQGRGLDGISRAAYREREQLPAPEGIFVSSAEEEELGAGRRERLAAGRAGVLLMGAERDLERRGLYDRG